jgi:hypothetical protein
MKFRTWLGTQRRWSLGGAVLVCEQALNQDVQLVGGQRRDPHQAGVEGLQLRLGHRVKVEAMNALVATWPLQPAEENLGGRGIRDCAFS